MVRNDFEYWWFNTGSGMLPQGEEDIEEFTNRVAAEAWAVATTENICMNCKHYSYNEEDENGHCSQEVDDGSDYSNYQVADGDVVDAYFGCIKFERGQIDSKN